MVYVITDPCVGTCDTACVQVCPVDCIHGPVELRVIESVPPERRGAEFPGLQLYINPEECIYCGACVPEVPTQWRSSIQRNAAFFSDDAASST
jgi:NAD-dependent dihydropyrimidine dehydrogenase PreA subunit